VADLTNVKSGEPVEMKLDKEFP